MTAGRLSVLNDGARKCGKAEAQECFPPHCNCANFFLQPDDDNPRVNAGCASQTAGEVKLKLVLHTYYNSSLPRAQCFGVPPRCSHIGGWMVGCCDGEGEGKEKNSNSAYLVWPSVWARTRG
jgi:hypothetical protein